MPRRYDSSRRQEAAARTRRDILRAALKLHWEGVAELEPLAREAGCSLATVRKHFPTKEELYRNCTTTFAEGLILPDIAALENMTDPARRVGEAVGELCRIHEAMSGYAWFSARERQSSPVLDEVLGRYEGLADEITRIVTVGNPLRAPVVRGFLDFLTYRALRHSGRLSPEQVKNEMIAVVGSMLSDDAPGERSPAHKGTRK
jgi:AcrR family transcriptional regulator